MVLFVSLLVLLVLNQNTADSVINGTELVFAFMIHRHGDRTPVSRSLDLASATVDLEVVEQLVAPWGYGQLTDKGMRRAHKLGEYIRSRYSDLLSPSYRASDIYVRSTDSDRAKMTALAVLAGVYPPVGEPWMEGLDWTPVPYSTVEAKYDFNMFQLNCPEFFTAMLGSMFSSPSSMDTHSEVLSSLSGLLGFNVSAIPLLTFAVHDIYVSLQNLGYDLSPEIKDLMPELREAAGVAMEEVYGNRENLAYEAGPLLNEFFHHAATVMAGDTTPSVRVYSAHDINVFALQAATRVAREGPPGYAALYSLELRRDKESGNYVVLPVYLPSPDEPEIYLQVEGCALLCDYSTFISLTSLYGLPEDQWRTKCGFTEDMVVDVALID